MITNNWPLAVEAKPSYNWQQPLTTDQLDNVVRAGGDVVCSYCGFFLRQHDLETRILDSNGYAFLNRGCDGVLYKL